MKLNMKKRVVVIFKASILETAVTRRCVKGMRKKFSSTRGFLPTTSSKRRRKNLWSFLFAIVFALTFIAFTSAVPENEFMSTTAASTYLDDAGESSAATATVASVAHRHHHNNRQQRQHQKHDEEHHAQDLVDGNVMLTYGNGTKLNQSSLPSEVISKESSFPHGYWIRVAQAKVMAFSVENGVLPKLDKYSEIMLRADCGKSEERCKNFNDFSKCAESKATSMINDVIKLKKSSNISQVPEYVDAIWENCQKFMNSSLSPSRSVISAPYGFPQPEPVFHCNTHVGANTFQTNFRIEYPGTLCPPEGMPSEMIPRYFVIEMREHLGNWEINSVQPFWLLRFGREVNHTFQIRITAVSPKYIYPSVVSDSVTLYESSVQKIGKPVNLTVVNISVDNTAARPLPSAILRWQSGSGLNASCDFDVFYMDEDMHKVERTKADEAFWVKLDGLHFDKSYSGKIMEKFGGNRESETLHYNLHIPTCLELRGYSFELCPPPPPSNVKLANPAGTTFLVKWDPPKYMNSTNRILSYNLTVDWIYTQSAADGIMHPSKTVYTSQRIFADSVPGNVTSVEIKNATHLRGKFKVSVTAIGSSGPSSASWDVVYYKGPVLNAWTVQKILTLFLALFGVAGLVGLFCLLKNYHERRQRKKKRQEKFENYEKESLQPPPPDREAMKWEIDCCSIMLGDAIGQGYFGLVRRATLNRKGRKIIVAVKTLRDGVDEKDVEKFWEEFEILKDLDPHVHVVGLKGIVTKHVPLPLLVVEYCDGGDLQSHLRKALQSPSTRRKYCPGSTISSGSSIVNLSSENRVQVRVVQNEAYFMKNEVEVPQLALSDLLSYSRQIACGMEYLSTNKIVHRDLAARNILIQNSGKQRILKISDFGLSRDVYEQNMYKKSTDGKVPIKWLAIECLLKEEYTTKSDVWSYGILLWEIFTYGGNPYPGVENLKMFDILKDGYRMPKPEHCPDDVYVLMKACWQDEPFDRPDFTAIRLILEDIIEKTTQVTYLNLEPGLDIPAEGEYGNKEPKLPPRRKNLPPIPFQRSHDPFNKAYA